MKTPEQIYTKIQAAEAANRSQSTMNRLWREYHKATDARKASHGEWAR